MRYTIMDETGQSVTSAQSEDTLPAEQVIPGGKAQSPVELGLRGWKAVLKRLYVMNAFHSLPLLAAGMAFYAFLALAPAIAAIVMIYGLVGDAALVSEHMQAVITIVPPDVASVIRAQLLAVVTANAGVTGIALLVAILIAIFGAMRASGAAIQALNIIYEEHESRSIVGFYWLSARLTIGAIALALTGIATISVFAWLEFEAARFIGPTAQTLAQILIWLVAALLASFAFTAVYRYAPDRRQAKWRWITLGSIVATVLWIAVTFAFGLYATYITNYNATYGSLGAVVALLMWLWLTAYAVLIGGLVNAESERQTAQDSTIGPDRPMGERGAVIADSPVLDAASRQMLEKQQRRRAERQARRATRSSLGLPRRNPAKESENTGGEGDG